MGWRPRAGAKAGGPCAPPPRPVPAGARGHRPCGVDRACAREGRVVESKSMAESWRNRKTLILSRTDMMGLLTPSEYVDCVEHAFRMHGLGRVYMEPKGHIVLDRYQGEWEVMPSYIEE